MTESAAPKAKRTWPLFTVAALSFVPFLGIFFGGAAATWGLISSRPRAMLAAMIALAGALLNIVGIMVFAFGRGGGSSPELADARSRMTQQEMLRVVEALEAYHATEHAYPPSLMALQRSAVSRRFLIILDNSSGPLHFPHEFRYVLAPGGESYDLVATGPDNVIGTADDIRPALPDSLKATSGLRPAAAGGPP